MAKEKSTGQKVSKPVENAVPAGADAESQVVQPAGKSSTQVNRKTLVKSLAEKSKSGMKSTFAKSSANAMASGPKLSNMQANHRRSQGPRRGASKGR